MDSVWASPIVFNGKVYIGVAANGTENDPTQKGEVFALNSATGAVIWTFNTSPGSTGGAGVWGSIAVDPALNAIYFGTSNAYGGGTDSLYSYSVISLNAATGALNWYNQVYNSLAVGADLDFGSTPNLFSVSISGVTHQAVGVGNKDGYYYIFDRQSGSLLERLFVGTGGGEGGIIGMAGYIYLGVNDPELFVPSRNQQVSGYSGVLVAITPSEGVTQWQFNTPKADIGSVAVIPGAVLVGDTGGNLYAVSSLTGQQLMHIQLSGKIAAGITEAEGFVFVPMTFSASNGVCAFSYP
jgi:polyvinyl alcohol dehydrogenase (cytochrome)